MIALCSVAVDLRVTQMVNQVMGVHAVLASGVIRWQRCHPAPSGSFLDKLIMEGVLAGQRWCGGCLVL